MTLAVSNDHTTKPTDETPLYLLEWPCSAPPPLTGGVLRSTPEDFVVEEELSLPSHSDAGEHLWLRIRKRGENTRHVISLIARALGLAPVAIGYAGLKDRHALSTQWISVHRPAGLAPRWEEVLPESVEVLETCRQPRKLRPGMLHGNRFEIVVRCATGDQAALDRRIGTIGERGVPNYFGEQRFGRDGDNLRRAHLLFEGRLRRPRRDLRGLLLSSARSWLFNRVLAQRVDDGSWDLPLPGDAFLLEGTSSYFVPESIDSEIVRRVAAADIHPTGPLWGEGATPTLGAVRALEYAVAKRYETLSAGLERAGLRQERRSLRLPVGRLRADWIGSEDLRLEFSLPRGSYATSVLREIVHYRNAATADR